MVALGVTGFFEKPASLVEDNELSDNPVVVDAINAKHLLNNLVLRSSGHDSPLPGTATFSVPTAVLHVVPAACACCLSEVTHIERARLVACTAAKFVPRI